VAAVTRSLLSTGILWYVIGLESQWEFLEPLIPAPKPGGRPRTTDMLGVVSAIFYVTCLSTGQKLANS
jgi:hypothetical protein